MNTKFVWFTLSLCLGLSSLMAQAPAIPEFGIVSQEALQQEAYPADTEAEAAILFDICKGRFERGKYGTEMRFEHRRRIKFYGDSYIEKANVEIPFYFQNTHKTELITGIKAYVINWENGEAVRHDIDKSDIFEEKTGEHWAEKKFAIPHVKAGSIIEYEYVKVTPYIVTFDWQFQQDIPVAWSEYQIDIPPFYEYQMEMQGRPNFSVRDREVIPLRRAWETYQFQDARFRFGMKDLPAFGNEPFITTPLDYLIMMKFQLSQVEFPNQGKIKYLKDWPGFVKDFLSQTDYGKSLGKKTGKNLILPQVEGLEGKAKAKKIYELVAQNLEWNGRRSRYPSTSIKEVLEQGEGNTTDINLWLCNMLNAAGIEAYPVLLSTRDHGKISKKYPFIEDFNTTVVYLELEGKGLLLDASIDILPFGVIHPLCLNEEGLILNRKNPEWITIQPNLAGLSQHQIALVYREKENRFEAHATIRYEGYDAAIERSRYFSDEEAYKESQSEEEVLSFSVKNAEDIEKPLVVKFSCEVPVVTSGDRIFIDPFFLDKMEDNPFPSPQRTFAVDYTYPKKREYHISIAIPKGYELEGSPISENHQLKDGSVSFALKSEKIHGLTLELSREFEIKSPLIQPEHYQQLKSLYDERVKVETSQLVLKKID